jgi:ribosomal protein L7/L12
MAHYEVIGMVPKTVWTGEVHNGIVDAVLFMDGHNHRIGAIKLIRAMLGLGLLEAKLLTERIIELGDRRY